MGKMSFQGGICAAVFPRGAMQEVLTPASGRTETSSPICEPSSFLLSSSIFTTRTHGGYGDLRAQATPNFVLICMFEEELDRLS